MLFDAAGRTTHEAGDIDFRQISDEAQRDGFALAPREPCDRPGEIETVVSAYLFGVPNRQTNPVTATTDAIEGKVGRHTRDPRLDVVADLLPARVRPDHRLLRNILGVSANTGDAIRRP